MSEVPHNRYTESSQKAFSSQADVKNAWLEGAYPTHNVDFRGHATLYSSRNFKGIQRPDGSGVLRHYRTREAIRTKNGLVLDNVQCWSTGFAHCTPPSHDERDARLPLDGVERMLRPGDNLFDIVDVTEGDGYKSFALAIVGDYGVGVGYDPSSRYNQSRFVLKMDGEEIERAKECGIEETIKSLLRPDETRERPVIPANEYAKTRLSEEEMEHHVEAGGNLVTRERKWGSDRTHNLQHYRANFQGSVVVRQGEWFFVPKPDFEASDHEIRNAPSAPLGNHIVARKRGAAKRGNQIYVRGEIRHRHGDHDAVNLGDTWHLAVTHDRNVRVATTGTYNNGGYRD